MKFNLYSLQGNLLTLSDGGGSVNLPIYAGGPGIDITGNVVTNTGDSNPFDDIIVGSTASGDLSGSFPNPKVTKLQGRDMVATLPSQGQVLRWWNGKWETWP